MSKDPTRKKTPWLVRWRDEQGADRKRGFSRKVDADRFRAEVEHSLNIGSYTDPAAARKPFRHYAEQWFAGQSFRPNTKTRVRSQLNRHILPALGHRPMSAIRTSELQKFATGLTEKVAPSTARTIFAAVRAVFTMVIRDRIITFNPCVGVKRPEVPVVKVVPFTVEQVEVLAGEMPAACRDLVRLVAGTGLRQGEAFGLRRPDVDLDQRELSVDRQVQPAAGGGVVVCPPKNDQSYRVVPFGNVVVSVVRRRVADFPPVGDEQWLFVGPSGEPWDRNRFNDSVWRPARERAAQRFYGRAVVAEDPLVRAELTRRGDQLAACGMHDLRHFYASALIRKGLSATVVAARLGHKNANVTLRTYAHLWEDDDDRSRQAIDDVFTRSGDLPALTPA